LARLAVSLRPFNYGGSRATSGLGIPNSASSYNTSIFCGGILSYRPHGIAVHRRFVATRNRVSSAVAKNAITGGRTHVGHNDSIIRLLHTDIYPPENSGADRPASIAPGLLSLDRGQRPRLLGANRSGTKKTRAERPTLRADNRSGDTFGGNEACRKPAALAAANQPVAN